MVNKIKTLEIKTRDGKTKLFEGEPILNYDIQAACFVIGTKDKLEAFFFPVVNIIYIKNVYELVDTKSILIPNVKHLSNLEASN